MKRERFEIGRRRPLHRNNGEKENSKFPEPLYMNPDEETDFTSILSQYSTTSIYKKKKSKKKTGDNPYKLLPPIEIDLHIHELIDSIAGMDNYAILQYQLDTVKRIMQKHFRRIGQKIIFIHGKGDGVLRKELRTLLAKEYASHDVQDASFQKYGFGATQVTIRSTR